MSGQTITKKMYLSVLSGIFLEYFDYTLYGFAISYITQAFFPTENHTVGLMLSWTVFSISFIVRPLGAIFFGHFADRFGRRVVLITTIIFMSLGTICMGLIPGYAQIGIMAPFLLLLCRVMQGISVSTEYSGASTYCLEFLSKNHGLNSGVLTGASGLGMFVASALFLYFGAKWREVFIMAGLIVGILGIYLRLSMLESPMFVQMKKTEGVAAVPFFQLLKDYPKLTLTGILISAYTGVVIIAIEVFLPDYLQTHFAMPKHQAVMLSTYLIFIEIFFAILCGWISDFIGQTRTLVVGGIIMLLFVYPVFMLFESSSFVAWYTAATCLALFVGAVDGPIAAYLVHSFPTKVRYTGVSVCYSLGAALCGGLSPLIITLLQGESQLPMLQIYIMISVVIFLLAVFILRPRVNNYAFAT